MTLQSIGGTSHYEDGVLTHRSRQYQLDGHLYTLTKNFDNGGAYILGETINDGYSITKKTIWIHDCIYWGEGWRWSRAEKELEAYHNRMKSLFEKFSNIAHQSSLKVSQVIFPESKGW